MLKILNTNSVGNHLDAKSVDSEGSYQPMLAIWVSKLAISLGWLRKRTPNKLPDIVREDGFISLTGVELPLQIDEDGDFKYFDKSYAKLTNAKLIKLFKNRLLDLYKMDLPNDLPLFANVDVLGNIVGLSKAEKLILIFATALTSFPEFRRVIASANQSVSHSSLSKALNTALGVPQSEILSALRDDGLLALTGIMETAVGPTDLERKITVTDGFSEMLLMSGMCEDDLIKAFLKSTEKPILQLSDYPHLEKDINVLLVYLANALARKEKGVNVLFYGVPGTGKTELVKALAESLQADLFEISYTDLSGDPVKGANRLKAFNLCQNILVRKQNVMLLFDEVEDVFESQNIFTMMFKGGSSTEKGKAWINRSLEVGSTPAVWVTNDENIDPAYLRRFDYSVRFPIPPNKVRQKIAQYHFNQFNPSEDWLARIAANDQVSPGQLERAAKVARIAGEENHELAKMLIEQTLDRSITLLGQKRIPGRNVLRTGYDLGFINTDLAVSRLVEAMKINPSGTFCFYGPAGTGKSELVRYIAYSGAT